VKRWIAKRVKIEALVLDERNPRTISEERAVALTRSIDRFGLVQPIVVNGPTGRVVGGHQRIEALRRLGEEEVDVIVVDLSEVDEKALSVALNSTELQGAWDPSLLSERLSELVEGLETDEFEGLRFDALSIELEGLFDDFLGLDEGGEEEEGHESAEDPRRTTRVKFGDLELDLDSELVSRVVSVLVGRFEEEDEDPSEAFEEIVEAGLAMWKHEGRTE